MFQVLPLLANVGHTPALKVRYAALADVFPFPLPDDFTFPPLHQPGATFGVIAPHQNFTIDARLNRRFEDERAETIKRATAKERLYIWGTVFYEDTFGGEHYTNFAHSIHWVLGKNGELLFGNYADRHNEAT